MAILFQKCGLKSELLLGNQFKIRFYLVERLGLEYFIHKISEVMKYIHLNNEWAGFDYIGILSTKTEV